MKRGGGNKIDACAKYRLQGTKPSIPAPIETNSISDESYTALLPALRAVPETSILLLKVGSNDSSVAQKAVSNEPGSGGSKGRDGTLFIELPYKEVNVDTNLFPLNSDPKFIRTLSKLAINFSSDIGKKDIKLLVISPVTKYEEFSYPFHKEYTEETIDKAILNVLHENISEKTYVETFFPLAPGSEKTNEVLDLIIARPEPLILFNAMGSYCYRSFKYINDMRKNAGRITIYMGLVDEAPYSQCDIGRTIYPDPETSCAT